MQTNPTAAPPPPGPDLSRIAQDLQIRKAQVEAVVQLLDEGNTVPFITRYRKERTGGLDEERIRRVQARVGQLRALAERRQTVLKAIEAQGKLTDALRDEVQAAESPKRLEDLYLPYKPKKRTLASEAREKGLEPFALAVWTRDVAVPSLAETVPGMVDPERDGFKSAEEILTGAGHVVAEIMAETADVRGEVRRPVWQTGRIDSKKADNLPENQGQEYKAYFEFAEPLADIPPHRILALNRGEKEGPLKIAVQFDRDLARRVAADQLPLADHPHREYLEKVLDDALDRLLVPSLEREVRRELTDFALDHAVGIFARNLRSLLLQPPLRGRRVLAIDPGLRTGCKLVVLDEHGGLIEEGVIFPHPPQKKFQQSKNKLEELIRRHRLDVVAIGNGTACRETEKLVAELITDLEARRAAGTAGGPVGGPQPPRPEPAPPAPRAETPSASPTVPEQGEGPTPAPSPDDATPPTYQPVPDAEPSAVPPLGAEASEPRLAAEGHAGTSPADTPPPPPPGESLAPVGTVENATASPTADLAGVQAAGFDHAPSSASEVITPLQAPQEAPPIGTHGYPSGGPAEVTPPVDVAAASEIPAPPATPPAPAPRPVVQLPPPVPLPEAPAELAYVIVNEAGASDYSASPVGREEFPGLDATVRGTISIGRRLQDPLAELVKIDPQHVGVGLYQHDVKARTLKESLEGVIESCVNHVGVDLNTASVPLLRHVAGLNQLAAKEVVDYRRANGPFRSREQLRSVPQLGEKRFEQAAGFLKIAGGDEPLDVTWIHPESYPAARQILADVGAAPDDLRDRERAEALREKLRGLSPEEVAERLQAGVPTVRDIFEALARPGRDPREDLPPPVFKKGVLRLEDLVAGMELKGTVLNVVDFGAFVDIGLKDSGLVHISQMANRFIKNPYEVVSVGDVVAVWVLAVDGDRRRVSLTMIQPGSERKQGPPQGGGGRGRGPAQGQGQERGTPAGEGAPQQQGGRPSRGPRQPRDGERAPQGDRPQADRPQVDRPQGDRPPPRRVPAEPAAPVPAWRSGYKGGQQGPVQAGGGAGGRPPFRGGQGGGGQGQGGRPFRGGQGGGGQGQGGRGGQQQPPGAGAEGAQAPPQPRTPRPGGKPAPNLSDEALKGKAPLKSFNELAAFFKKSSGEPEQPPQSPPKPPESEGAPPQAQTPPDQPPAGDEPTQG